MAADAASLVENTPPRRRLAWLRRLVRFFLHPNRKLTRAEQREIDGEKLARARQKSNEAGLQLEADIVAQQLIGKLKDKGVRYEYRKRDGTGLARFKLVTFMRPYVIRDEAIYLKVDLRPGKSPPGIGVKELSNPEIIPDLEIAVGHPVKTFYSAARGFWYIIERELGKRGIPNHVKFDEVLAARPTHLDGLALPLGVGADKRVAWRSLNRMYSLLIAGTTGSGKSNAINAMICALLVKNTPRHLRLLLVDLKGGVEFTFFQDVPHLLPVPVDDKGTETAIIERREQVIPALEWLVKEGERRLELIKSKRVKNVGEYNQHWGPLPHIVLVIDEWADVKVEPKIGTRAEELLVNVSNRFRAAGIHVILCTQSPTKEVVSLRIKNAMPARLAFSMANIYASMLVVGNSDAFRMEPEGRAIFDWNQAQFELQTPYINNDTVDSVVAQAIKGEFDDTPPKAHDVTDQEIYQWAVEHNEGFIDSRTVYSYFRARGLSKEYAEAFCQRAEGQSVMISSTAYKVLPRAKQNEGRRLLPIDQIEELAQAQSEKDKPPAPAVTADELVAWALEHNQGRLQKNAVWDQFRGRGLSNKAAGDMCKALEGQVVTVAGREYRVLPSTLAPGRGAQPRRLQALVPDIPGGTDGETSPAPAEAGHPAGPDVEPAPAETPGEQAAERPDGDTSGAPRPARLDETITGTLAEVASPTLPTTPATLGRSLS